MNISFRNILALFTTHHSPSPRCAITYSKEYFMNRIDFTLLLLLFCIVSAYRVSCILLNVSLLFYGFLLVLIVLFFLLFCFIFSQVLVVFEAKYVSPDDASGNFEPTNLVRSIQQQHNISCSTQSLDDDQQMLLDIEQNIANLERSLNKGECRIKLKKKINKFL